jgi:hypothetical protein
VITTEVVNKTFYVLLNGERVGSGAAYYRNVIIAGKVYSKQKAIKHLIALHREACAKTTQEAEQ